MKKVNKNNIILRVLIITLFAICATLFGSCGSKDSDKSDKKDIVVKSFAMQENITLDLEKDNTLNYVITLDKQEYSDLKSNSEIKNIEFGVLIAPSSYEDKYKPLNEAFNSNDGKAQYIFIDNDKTLNFATNDLIEIYKISSNNLIENTVNGEQIMLLTCSTGKISDADINLQFSAVGYIKIEERSGVVNYFYTENNNYNSVSFVASKMLNSDNSFDDLQKDKLLTYVKSAINGGELNLPRYMLLDNGYQELFKSKLDLKIESQGESVEIANRGIYALSLGTTNLSVSIGDVYSKNFTVNVINLDINIRNNTEYFLPSIDNVKNLGFYKKGDTNPLELFDGAVSFTQTGDYEFVITDLDNVITKFTIEVFENVESSVSFYNPSGTVEQISNYKNKNNVTKISCEKGNSLINLGFDSDNWEEISSDFDYVKFNVLYEFDTKNLDSNKVGVLCGTSQWIEKDITVGEWKEVKICLKDFINRNKLYFTSSLLPSLDLVRSNFNRNYYKNSKKFLYSADPAYVYDNSEIQMTLYFNDISFGVDNEKPSISFDSANSYQINKVVNLKDIIVSDNLDSFTHKIADFGLEEIRGGSSINVYKINANGDEEEISISNKSFVPNYKGLYKIKVKAIDAKSNTNEKNYFIKVN